MTSDIDVVGEASDGTQAVAVARRERPDVMVMDIRMPVMDGLVATERITSANAAAGRSRPAVLVLTTFDDEAYVLSAVRAGASGFLLKDTPPRDLAAAVRTVARSRSAHQSPGPGSPRSMRSDVMA